MIEMVQDILQSKQIRNQQFKFTIQYEMTNDINETLKQELKRYETIPRGKNIREIKQLFKDNEKELEKTKRIIPGRRQYENIPEDEDLEIIDGFRTFKGSEKHLVSDDEHFWGYKELISTHFQIEVNKEKDL
mgnify:CR=1 FL=1